MDNLTIHSYNQQAKNIAEFHSALKPIRLYELIQTYFVQNKSGLDIGCGAGRDTEWLNSAGFPTIGIDASEGMLKEAKNAFPNWQFIQDSLPSLNKLGAQSYTNLLCAAVLMHLNAENIFTACQRLFELMEKNGHLIISFRSTQANDFRETGKLYSPIFIQSFIDFWIKNQCLIVLEEIQKDNHRNIEWYNFVIKK